MAVRDLADQKRQEKLADAGTAALREFQDRLARLGLSVQDVLPQALQSAGGGRKKRRDAGRPLPVRYRGPHGEQWSGRGHAPRWIMDLEGAGHNREEFRVTDETA